MGSLQEKLEYIKGKIQGKIAHPFLSQNFVHPKIDDDKLLLLISVLDGEKVPDRDWEQFAIPTMLLQLALDTHERVTNDGNGMTFKARQLTVLAGTFYSGLYYKMLSERNEIELIGVLAEGIKTINDHKIIVYQKEMHGIEKLMDSIRKIEASLFKKVATYLQAYNWDELIENFLFMKRLIHEKDAFMNDQNSVLFDALRKLVFPRKGMGTQELSKEQKNYLILICDRYIDFAKHLLLESKNRLAYRNEILDRRIFSLIDEHQPLAKSLVEEG